MSDHEQRVMGDPVMASSHLTDIPGVRLLTSLEAAQYLAVSEPTLRKWRVIGGGPLFVKFGSRGRVCYRIRDLDAFIEARIQTSTSAKRG